MDVRDSMWSYITHLHRGAGLQFGSVTTISISNFYADFSRRFPTFIKIDSVTSHHRRPEGRQPCP